MRYAYLILLIVPLAARTAAADFVTIGPNHDATIYSGNVNNSNGAGPGMFAGNDGGPQTLRGLIQFDVAGSVPAGSTITGAQLTLSLGAVAGSGANADTGNRMIELHRLLATWGEGTTEASATTIGLTGQGAAANAGDGTWTDRFWSSTTPTGWTAPGGDFVTTASATAAVGTAVNTAYSWVSTAALVADVQGWLDNPGTNDGWLLRNSSETDVRTYRAFWTRDAVNATVRPQLQITYTAAPEPTALVPVVVLAGALMRRRDSRWNRNGRGTCFTITGGFKRSRPRWFYSRLRLLTRMRSRRLRIMKRRQ
jgi:hypothetical protein